MVEGRGLAGALEALGHEADRVVALRVHHHERALAARDLEHLKQLAVVQDEIVIGHEHLEGGVPGLDERRQLLAEHLGRRLSDDEMKADVDVALPLRFSAVLLEHSRNDVPLTWSANGRTQVLPPAAAAAVPEAKSSAGLMSGPAGWAKWTWLSIPPGKTRRPEASISRPAPSTFSATVAIRPARMPISARHVSEAVTTVPPRMATSNSGTALSVRSAPSARLPATGFVLRGIEHNRFTPGRRTFKPVAHSSHRATASSSKHCDRADGRAASLVDLEGQALEVELALAKELFEVAQPFVMGDPAIAADAMVGEELGIRAISGWPFHAVDARAVGEPMGSLGGDATIRVHHRVHSDSGGDGDRCR